MAASPYRSILASLLLLAVTVPAIVSASEPVAAKPLRWPKGSIKLAVSSSLFSNQNSIKAGTDVSRSLVRAIGLWEAVADVEIEIVSSELISANSGESAGDGVSLITAEPTNENLALFTKQQANATAVTRVFFNARNEITEADIALNPVYQFSDDGTPGTYDLDRVFAHEIGHLLGLKHAVVPSALMYEEVQKNSLNWSSGQTFRLSPDDMSKVRSIYGASVESSDCCSAFTGNIAGFTGKANAFAVDTRNGSVVASAAVGKTGNFEFGGIPEGNYEIWLANAKSLTGDTADVLLGRANASIGESKVLNLKSRADIIDFSVDRIGFIGRLSKRAISLERGRSTAVIISGIGINSARIKFGTTSRNVKIVPSKDISAGFAKGESVVQLELEVSPDAAIGSFAIYAENEKGVRKHLFGVLTVN